MKLRWSDTVGFFGGTFDPPHLGHLQAAEGLLQKPGLQKILLSPAPMPPQKTLPIPYPTRKAWLEKLLTHASPSARGRLEIDEIEYKMAGNAQGPSYTFDTLQKLTPQIPRLAFVMGADQFLGLPTWHRFPEILGLCHWIVLLRKGTDAQTIEKQRQIFVGSHLLRPTQNPDFPPVASGEIVRYQTPGNTLFLLCETDAMGISSREIRAEIQTTSERSQMTLRVQNALPPELEMDYRVYLKQNLLCDTSRPS